MVTANECFELLESIENDDQTIPAGLWDRIKAEVDRRRGVICEACYVDVGDFLAALTWYRMLWERTMRVTPWIAGRWPTPEAFMLVCGYAGMKATHALEDNHILPICEGGERKGKTERICLKCHREHTRGVVKRAAKRRRVTKKFHNGASE